MIDLPTEADPVRVIEGDCLDVLRALPDGCVDAVITDPPYPCIKREYGYWTEAEWFDLMNPVVEQCRRVLKPTGSAVFVLQPNSERVGRMRTWLWRFMLEWGDKWGQVQDVWWWNWCAIPEAHAIQGRLTRPSLKACVWLGSPECWRDQNAVLDAPSPRMLARMKQAERDDLSGRLSYPSGQGMDMARACKAVRERGGVSPFNVIAMHHGYGQRSAGAHGHGAGTPVNLCRWWVRYICPPGGTVLEPFLGSGTVALAAVAEGRKCLGVERMPKYAEIARERVRKVLGKDGLFAETTEACA